MRAIDCPCGHRLEAENDEAETETARIHFSDSTSIDSKYSAQIVVGPSAVHGCAGTVFIIETEKDTRSAGAAQSREARTRSPLIKL